MVLLQPPAKNKSDNISSVSYRIHDNLTLQKKKRLYCSLGQFIASNRLIYTSDIIKLCMIAHIRGNTWRTGSRKVLMRFFINSILVRVFVHVDLGRRKMKRASVKGRERRGSMNTGKRNG